MCKRGDTLSLAVLIGRGLDQNIMLWLFASALFGFVGATGKRRALEPEKMTEAQESSQKIWKNFKSGDFEAGGTFFRAARANEA